MLSVPRQGGGRPLLAMGLLVMGFEGSANKVRARKEKGGEAERWSLETRARERRKRAASGGSQPANAPWTQRVAGRLRGDGERHMWLHTPRAPRPRQAHDGDRHMTETGTCG